MSPHDDHRPLLAMLPARERLPHTLLATLPTPVQPLAQLSEALELAELHVKRDDLSGALYGGNKVRKLEFILGEALNQNFREVITLGAIGSHHVLATCIYARHLGLQPCAQHFPQPITPHVLDNLRALSTTQPELELVGHPVALPFHRFKRHFSQKLAGRPQTFSITGGGSSITGVLGYVNAALELAEQIARGETPAPDRIIVAAGTNGTLAGLVLGCKLAGLKTQVCGVRVVDRVVTNVANVLTLANGAAMRLRELGLTHTPHIMPQDVTLLDGYFGSGYGEPTSQGARALDLARRFEGLELDPTYTAKAFSALLDPAHRVAWAGQRILYWHTLNGVDLSARIASAEPLRDLPLAYHHLFAAER